jgi:hypothetical protein
VRNIGLLIPRRDVDAFFVDNERRDRIPTRADALNDYNSLAIAWLNELWPS